MSASLASIWSIAWAPLWLFFLHPLWRRSASPHYPWVIGGHRGRAYSDNSAAVELEARSMDQATVWIANRAIAQALAKEGIPVLTRGTWSARRAISQASALIYSHGEDDLDLFLLLLRGRTAFRIYLNHSLNLLKAGGVTDPQLKKASPLIRFIKLRLLTAFDALLCASEKERTNFKRSYPMQTEKMHLGGGAHLDEWAKGLGRTPKKQIYWFPTFRDTPAGSAELEKNIERVCASTALQKWLLQNGYRLLIGSHINIGKNSDSSLLSLPFVAAPLAHLVRDIRESELLISDYSGVVFDYLLLKRPQILFAFDLENYLKTRALYVKFSSLDFALHPRTADELVDALVLEKFRDPTLESAATRWREKTLPPYDSNFSKQSYASIRRLLAAAS